MVKANAVSGYPTTFEDWKTYYSSEVTWYNNLHIFFNIESDNRTDSVCIILPPDKINSGNNNAIYCEYANNILIIRGNLNYSDIGYYYGDSATGSSHLWSYGCYAFQLDFNTNTGYALLEDGTKSLSWRGITDFTFTNFETDWDGYSEFKPLDLDISFKPTLSGTISRNTVIDGKDYTSKTLDMYVTNNGNDAQFAMFIVPKGDNITFPEHLIEDNQGFIGNPVFVYVSDEWSSFNVGLLGNSVYSPCSWHTVPKGFQNQLYSISWTQMMLQANTEYDCVVYACVNDTAVQTNTSSQWEMRPVYTVSSSLGEVEEIYRSTFSISDPAEFNPNYVDEAGTSHPWNPQADNSNLFNVASAYRDDNGNVVIKGQSTNGGFDLFSPDISEGSVNINNTFGSFFGFFTSIFGFLPSPWIGLITLGLSAIVIAAIIKKVTS